MRGIETDSHADYFVAPEKPSTRGWHKSAEDAGTLRPAYRLIMDLDDTRGNEYGEWYTDDNPLTQEKMLPPAG